MLTRYLTSLNVSFNPFSPLSKTPRVLLAMLPPNARSTMQITTRMLPRESTEPPTLELKFKDGKLMKMEVGKKLKVQDVVDEVERHSRILKREEELKG
jgi:large subunit ribosomal protein L53